MFLLGGLCVGGAAVLMALLADKAQELFRHVIARSEGLALLVTPAGFALCGHCPSPIEGAKGNRETLLVGRHVGPTPPTEGF